MVRVPKFRGEIALMVLGLGLGLATASADDWPQWHGIDRVAHEGEVARLAAVAVDGRGSLLRRGLDEERHDGRVLGAGRLPRPEDVEEAKRHRLQTVGRIEGLDVSLAGRLRRGQAR